MTNKITALTIVELECIAQHACQKTPYLDVDIWGHEVWKPQNNLLPSNNTTLVGRDFERHSTGTSTPEQRQHNSVSGKRKTAYACDNTRKKRLPLSRLNIHHSNESSQMNHDGEALDILWSTLQSDMAVAAKTLQRTCNSAQRDCRHRILKTDGKTDTHTFSKFVQEGVVWMASSLQHPDLDKSFVESYVECCLLHSLDTFLQVCGWLHMPSSKYIADRPIKHGIIFAETDTGLKERLQMCNEASIESSLCLLRKPIFVFDVKMLRLQALRESKEFSDDLIRARALYVHL